MKKKMLFMAAIAGLVSLGSCVKDDVSGSVEAVRNAKANELNAKANEHNANAAVQNAEAALKNAVQSAEVALKQAQAALQQAQAESAQLDTQLKKDRYAAELEAAISTFDATTAANEAAIQQSLNALKDALKAASTKDLEFVENLVARYNAAYSNFVTAQGEVLAANTNLEKAKIDQAYSARVIASTIFGLQSTIDEKTALIAALKEMQTSAPTVAEAKVEISKLEIEKTNAMAEFGNSDAVKALVEAGQALAAAKKAFDKAETASFGKVNNMVTEAFGQKVTYYTKAGGTPITGYLEPGTKYDSNGDGTKDKTIAKPAWWTANYYESVGDPKEIKPAASFVDPVLNFYDWTEVLYEYTVDSDGDGKNDSKAQLKGKGASVLNGTNFEVSEFRVNDRTKYEADKYFENLPSNSKKALTKAKNELALLNAEMGTEKDNKNTKYTDAKGNEVQTLYAKLAEANENKTKADATKTTAKAAYDTANDAYETAKSGLATAYKNAAADPSSTKAQSAIEDAKEALAKAMEDLFGEAQQTYVKKSNPGYNETYFDRWIAGADGTVPAMTNSKAGTKALYELFDTVKEINAWIAANLSSNYVDEDGDSVPDKDDDGNVIPVDLAPGHVYKDSVKDKYEKADKGASDANKAVTKAKIAIFGEYGTDGKLKTEGQVQKIESKKDEIAVKYEPEAADAQATKAAYEAAVKAADVESYQKAADDLSAAADSYNAAAWGVVGGLVGINDYDTQIAAYKAVITNDIASAIADAEEDLAKAEKDLALINYTDYSTAPASATGVTTTVWDPNGGVWDAVNGKWTGTYKNVVLEMSWDQIVSYYEAAVTNAEVKLAAATAELALAQKALENLDIEIDLDGDDEPADEPAEEPEEPAGEEPAEGEGEGEGEAEGGEEA